MTTKCFKCLKTLSSTNSCADKPTGMVVKETLHHNLLDIQYPEPPANGLGLEKPDDRFNLLF